MAAEPDLFDASELKAGARLLQVSEVAGRLRGARLCYGEPVQAGSRTVIPVASVFVAGGLGFGGGTGDEGRGVGEGGGGGGTLSATPIGYIEIGEDGARFRRIVDTTSVLRILGRLAVSGVAAGVARRRLRR